VFVALGFEVAKKALGWYVDSVPTYSAVYGAFATVPILLLWVYTGWVIVLLGAVIAAYAPSLQMRVSTREATPGWRFELSLAVLRQLQAARLGSQHGLSLAALGEALRADPLQLEPVVDMLAEIDWVSRLDEGGDPRHVLLCDPARTPVALLVNRTLLAASGSTAAFREHAGLDRLMLAEVLAG
jgi:membrane protein